MKIKPGFSQGVIAAIGAAVLFGCGTPLAKLLLEAVSPWMLAGLFYLGSGIGLLTFRLLRRSPPVKLASGEWKWLTGAIFCGGVLGPVLLMFGLTNMPATGASLLLNAEGVFTALLAWFAFKENFDRRIALGMGAIVLGAMVLSWPDQTRPVSLWSSLAVLAACLAWGLDNNLTRQVSLADATWIASVKGLAAGAVNLGLAFAFGLENALPSVWSTLSAMVVGCLAYGVSLALFVVALRYLGTARTGAYFSLAPFFGAALSIPLLGEAVTPRLLTAGALMGVGIWLHLTERHQHLHRHEPLEHEHEHAHDEHHPHTHRLNNSKGAGQEQHSHWHRHEPLTHEHPHFPDAHHRHEH